MRQDYFSKFGYQLVATYRREPSEVVWQEVHGWLADAPINLRDEHIALWPYLLDAAFQSQVHHNAYNHDCVASLKQYLSWLVKAPESLLREHLLDDSFLNLLHNTPTQAVMQTVHIGWEPGPLMERLDTLDAPATKDYAVLTLYDVIRNVYHWISLLLEQPELNVTAHGLYVNVLDVYSFEGHKPASHGEHLVRALVRACPEHLPRIVAFVGNEKNVQEVHVEALFPLPLEKVPQQHMDALLHALVGLAVDAPGYAGGQVMPLLHKHHPELAALLELHTCVFSDLTRECTYTEVLLGPYKQILQGATSVATVGKPIDSGVFDDRTTAL